MSSAQGKHINFVLSQNFTVDCTDCPIECIVGKLNHGIALQCAVPNIKQDHEDTGQILDGATVLMMRGKTMAFVGLLFRRT